MEKDEPRVEERIFHTTGLTFCFCQVPPFTVSFRGPSHFDAVQIFCFSVFLDRFRSIIFRCCCRFVANYVGEEGTLQECICANKKGMVYLLDDWGMGDTETRNRKYAEPSRDLLRRDQHVDGCDEVDLHPLSNQVSSFTIRYNLEDDGEGCDTPSLKLKINCFRLFEK
jgi:hypothetical protein